MVLAITNVAPGFRALPLSIHQLCLSSVLKCGQSFRWSAFPLSPEDQSTLPSHEYRFCLQDRVVCLRQTPDNLFYRSEFAAGAADVSQREFKEAETLSWIRDYFQLDIDLVNLHVQWSAGDPVIGKLGAQFGGIRVLRQDPFECLISFICSSNNNISRITNMVNALCKQFSPPLVSLPLPGAPNSHETYYPFPPPSALASPEVAKTLRTLGFGYRAEFIQKTAQMLVERHGSSGLSANCPEPAEVWLMTLREMSTAEAREELLKLMGVGRKVADCVLLMSLDKPDVVPVDTHVHQIAIKHYGWSTSSAKTAMSPKLYEQLTTKFVKVWGPYAGWAHVVLFTSDLKAFSIDIGVTLSANSPTKRKRAKPLDQPSKDKNTLPVAEQILTVVEEDGSLAERVKRRRRGALNHESSG